MRPILTCLMVLLTFTGSLGQAPDSGKSVLEALSEQADRLDLLWEAGNYRAAVGLLHEMKRDALKARKQDLGAALAYTLGCGYSLLNDPSAALVQLSAAVDLGFSDFILMREDPELENVRRLPEFEWLLQQAKEAHRVEWDRVPGGPPTVLADDPDCEEFGRLRREHNLDAVVEGSRTDRERLLRIVSWAHRSFAHDGANKPSSSDPLTILSEAAEGTGFRCVEYATLVVAGARALGMPARELCLATRDVEARPSGAGHVVAEVWLRDAQAWAFADAQAGIVPERNGAPLNAVQFREAIWNEDPDIKCTGGADGECEEYQSWILPYLYYFFLRGDQRFYADSGGRVRDVMLLPVGARRPGASRRTSGVYNNTRFTSNPEVFYALPRDEGTAMGRRAHTQGSLSRATAMNSRRSE
jgi:hypothetical protein